MSVDLTNLITFMPVLDHGFVELIDIMGDDYEPARAARLSYKDGKERSTEADLKLSYYLLKHNHTTPFEMVELKWRVKLPIFVARQWVRHRTANINEFSMRYADPERLSEGDRIDFYTPDEWRRPNPDNKQGSIAWDSPAKHNHATSEYARAVQHAITNYHFLQREGIANEQARMVLPVSVYTEWIWKNDLHNTFHFLRLRADPHAQWEMQEYARAMIAILNGVLPNLMELWQETR